MNERPRIVFVGHVDHGKSSIVGRLLADSGATPPEKIDQVRKYCEQNAKPFEHAFLADALNTERSQGITIEAAKLIFRIGEMELALVDAPGHEDFLRNMVSGASFADAAFLVVDGEEGFQATTAVHARLLALLGVRRIILLVNKMDRVNWAEERYRALVAQWEELAEEIGVPPGEAVPVSARGGENIVTRAADVAWYAGPTLLELLMGIRRRETPAYPMRFFVQDIYKFASRGDDRRIIAGTLQHGVLHVGDELVFSPSTKRARVKSIEGNGERVEAGESFGITLDRHVYLTRGQLASKIGEAMPHTSLRFRGNVFWFGDHPLSVGDELTVLFGTGRTSAHVEQIDAAESMVKGEVRSVSFRARGPVSFDVASGDPTTSRFALSSAYALSGGGQVLESLPDSRGPLRDRLRSREEKREWSLVPPETRADHYGHRPAFVLITGDANANRKEVARRLELALFGKGCATCFLPLGNFVHGLDSDLPKVGGSEEHFRRLAEVGSTLVASGLIVCVSGQGVRQEEVEVLRTLLETDSVFVIRYGTSLSSEVDADLELSDENVDAAVAAISELLERRGVFRVEG